ncbi:hypothetical protein QSU92_01240 [Microbacterium sp. ET2]|uniref:hypothetical protein n=1 Tax=Microbacterium albipurpureum TaxID=3050384 RepID=UPI00259CB96A|nr:hypothetical protein [Microbacterium sp. ET2 (Ac-2212)]WJL95880.1 hypothetical protein QSU92_01240 [Microbacterium sp. ET2 (Ac-2212)]
MTRRLVTGPSILLTQEDARILYRAANLGDLRTRYRVGNKTIYDLLTDITVLALSTPDAARGNEQRQPAASEEREYWTTQQVATAARQAERTVRLACQRQEIPAEKPAGTWLIRNSDARTYINTHRPR